MHPDDARAMEMAEALVLRTAIALRHGWTWGEPSYADKDIYG